MGSEREEEVCHANSKISLRIAAICPNAYFSGSLRYIIDFESVRQLDDGAAPKHFIPEIDFYAWDRRTGNQYFGLWTGSDGFI